MKEKNIELLEFANRLKKIRFERQLTQQQLGELTGMSNVQIARYENAITKPTQSSIKKLSDALNIKYELLAGGFFHSKDELSEFDATIERAKKLPKRDILFIKEMIDSYVGFKELTSTFYEVVQ